jgi:lipopolysaccharide transport system permease protein
MSNEIAIYTPESEFKNKRQFFRAMFRDVKQSRELAWNLFKRDIQGQYRQSLLGFFWAFVTPVITATTFTLASNFKVLNIGTTGIPYPAYIVFSTTLWQTFVESVNVPMAATNGSMSLFTRIKMPKEAPIMAKILEIYFNFLIKLILIVAVFIIYRLPVSSYALLAPFALTCMIVFGLAIGLLLTPVSGIYSDIGRGLSAILSVGMFITPVVYPRPKEGFFGSIVNANPVTHLLIGIRELTLFGKIPNLELFISVSIVGFVLLFIAWVLFRLSMPFVIERRS